MKQTSSKQRPGDDAPKPPRPLVAVMSSGFFGFFAHAGFLQALADLGLEPDAYAGSSSGALAAAFAAGGMTPRRMLDGFGALRRSDFWDPPRPAGLIRLLLNGFRGRTGYLSGRAFAKLLERDLPAQRFEDCPKPCLISTLDLETGRRRILKQGPLAPAVVASGAVPMMFCAPRLEGRLLLDGGLVDKAPLLAAREHLGAASLVVHLLPSSSLDKPLTAALHRPGTPLRIQARAIDGARWQNYLDQMDRLREMGVKVWEVRGEGLPRLGPRRLRLGPEAFAKARANARFCLDNSDIGIMLK